MTPRTPRTTADSKTCKALTRRAVFMDRDGTLIVDRHYLKEPALVELVAHATNAVRRFNYALLPVIVVTNQSGIARGLVTEQEYRAVRARLDDLLEERGAFIEDHYHCPHHPDFTGPCECRKPGIALFEQAIIEHQIDSATSVFIGDKFRDIQPALTYGARGILVPSPDTAPEDVEQTLAAHLEIAASLTEAALMILPAPQEPER